MLCYEADSVRRPGGRERHPGRGNLSKNNIPTISTGNILREALKSGTEMGLKAKTYMESGKLVPDEILIGVIKDRLSQEDCKGGFILDGFPRTIPQAEALDNMGVEIDAVLDIEVADEDIITRMSGRRVCEKSADPLTMCCTSSPVEGQVRHFAAAPSSSARTTTPTLCKERLEVYHTQTEPLKEYYSKQGKLLVVHGQEKKVEDTIRPGFGSSGGFDMIVLKTSRELSPMMGRPGKISQTALKLAGEAVEPGVSTWEIDKIVRQYIEKMGAAQLSRVRRVSGQRMYLCKRRGHPRHTLQKHYSQKRRDIVGIDIGACYEGFHGDNAWTFPCGEVSERPKRFWMRPKKDCFRNRAGPFPATGWGISVTQQAYVEARNYLGGTRVCRPRSRCEAA